MAQLGPNTNADLASGIVTAPASLKDFSLVCDAPLSTDILQVTATSARFQLGSTVMESPLDATRPHVIAVVVKRDPRQALSGLWVDGVEVRSASVPPGETKITPQNGFTVYSRTLTRPEIIERSLGDTPPSGWAVIGGTEAVAIVESGYLEAFWMPTEPVRCLAWEGDTVFQQDRPLNFGTLSDQLKRVRPKGVIAMFGRQECLEKGAAGLEKFISAFKSWGGQMVIVGPMGFEKKPPPLRDLSALNASISEYSAALSKLPGQSFIDLSQMDMTGATRDGLTLTDDGCKRAAQLIAAGLGSKRSQADARALTLIQEKNRLWHHYWRPANWAFLYRDRTAQPSSRDHLDPKVRWFPGELEQYRSLIAEKEKAIWNLSPVIP